MITIESFAAVQLRRARTFGIIVAIIDLLFLPVAVADFINTGSPLGTIVGFLVLAATWSYVLLVRSLALRPTMLVYLTVLLILLGFSVHDTGGFQANITGLFSAALMGACFVLAHRRWNIAATLVTLAVAVTLAVLEITSAIPASKPGLVLQQTTFSYQINALINLILIIIGVGAIMTAAMELVNKREQALREAQRETATQSADLQALTAQLEHSNTSLRAAETLLRGTVADLTVTALPVLDGVLVLPLVGAFDDQRASHVIDHVLADIHHRHAHTIIVDLTSVRHATPTLAHLLERLTTSARLLGARVMIAGLQPELARVLVSLNVDRTVEYSAPTLAQAISHLLAAQYNQ